MGALHAVRAVMPTRAQDANARARGALLDANTRALCDIRRRAHTRSVARRRTRRRRGAPICARPRAQRCRAPTAHVCICVRAPALCVWAAEVHRARARLQQAGRHAPPVRASTACSPARTHTSVCTPAGGHPRPMRVGAWHAPRARSCNGQAGVRRVCLCARIRRARPCTHACAHARAYACGHPLWRRGCDTWESLPPCVCACVRVRMRMLVGRRACVCVCVRACVRVRLAYCIASARARAHLLRGYTRVSVSTSTRACGSACACVPASPCGCVVTRTGVTARQCGRVRCTFTRVLVHVCVCVCGCTCVHGHACGDERRLCAGVHGRLLACWPARVHACRRAFLFVDVCSSINVFCVCACVCAHAGVHDCVPTGARVRVCLCGRALVCGGVWAGGRGCMSMVRRWRV